MVAFLLIIFWLFRRMTAQLPPLIARAALLHDETRDGIDAYRAAGMPMHAEPSTEA